jgi:hypothetical protein|tara:strand:+ start:116 stop:631 length:516 start_codon:yes stop_codon:yes gene_type:complete
MKKTLLVLIVLVTVSGCGVKMGVSMPMGDGVYTLTGNGRSGYVPLGNIRRKVFKQAGLYAQNRNAELEVISVNEVKAGFAIWPQVDLTFRLVNESLKITEPNNLGSKTIINSSSANGSSTSTHMTRKKDNATKADNKYDRLSKIGELRTLGILTEEEFQKEKEKILNDKGN